MEKATLHKKISMMGIFLLLFQIFGSIISISPTNARIASFPNSYQLTSNASDESNMDATSYNGAGYVTYERSGTIYIKQGIGSEETVGSGSNPVIAVGTGGVIHLAYENGGNIMYAKKTSSWSTEVVSAGSTADIDVDSGNFAHIVYQTNVDGDGYTELAYSQNTSGSFVQSIFADGWYDSGSGNYYYRPKIKIDSNDKYHIAYEQQNWGGRASWSDKAIVITSNAAGGSASKGGFDWNSGVSFEKNSLTLDSGGVIHFLYNYLGVVYHVTISGDSWSETSLGSGINTPSITTDTGIVGIAYNDGSNNLNFIYDTGGGFSSPETITTGTYPTITFNGGERFFYALQSDGVDNEVWLYSMNSVYMVPGQIDNSDDSFVLANGGDVILSSLEVGGVYMLMSGSTLVSSGVLIATDTTGNLELNPIYFTTYGKYTLTLSGSYNDTTTPDIDMVSLYIGPVDYQDLYVNQIAPTLLTAGVSTNLGNVTYTNVQGFTGLSFEKTGLGKIYFSSTLDLTNSGTISFLQSLPSKLDMSNGMINFDPTDSDFANYGAQLSMYFDTGSTFITGINDPSSFVVKSLTGSVLESSGTLSNIVGACGVGDPYCTLIFDTAHFTSFDLRPVLTEVSIRSDNIYSGSLARNGDRLILEFTASEALTGSSIGFDNPSIESVEDLGGNRYRATSVPLDLVGPIMPNVSFGIWPRDTNGNIGNEYNATTDGSSVRYDIVSPTAEVLYNPIGTGTTAGDVIATLANQSEDIIVTNNSGSFTYTFTENGSFTFEYRDNAGNTGSTIASVANINKSVPVITLNGSGSINIEQGSPYIELGATWSDQTDGSGSVSTISGSVNTGTLGSYPITYIYVNSLGVTGSTLRTINVIDTTPPVVPTLTTASSTTSGSSLSNLSGSGEAGSSIYLYKNGNLVCGANTVNESGSFVIVNFSNCLSLNEGANTFTAYAQDPSGNSSATGNTIILTRDSTVPGILYTEVTDITNNQANLEFAYTEVHFLNETASVELYQGASHIGTLGINEYNGNVGYTTFSGLSPDTTYTFILSLTDDAGNTETVTGSFTTTLSIFRGEVPTDIFETGGLLFGDVDGYVSSGNTFSLGGNNVYIYSDPGDSDSASGNLTLSGVDIVVLSGNWNGILLPPSLIDNDNPLSASGGELGSGLTPVQTIQAGAEGSSLSSTGGYFWVSFQVSGYPVGTVFSIYRSEDGNTWTPVSPDSTCTLDSDLMCTFRTDHLSLFAPAIDTTPDAFSFTATTNTEINTSYTSNTITISGISTGTTISVTGGEYQIGTGTFTSSTGTVLPSEQVTLRGTSSSSYNTSNTVTLTVGGVSGVYSITTKSPPSSGGGGGGGGPTIDNCPLGDTSGSLYDNKCVKRVDAGTGVIQTGATQPAYKDIKNSFARGYIEALSASGIIWGYPNGTFRPNTMITRGDWIVWVMKAYKIPLIAETGSVFQDIPENMAWTIPYLNTAKELGIINGYAVQNRLLFRPNAHITRAEALKILFNISKLSLQSEQKLIFADKDMKTWMIPYVIRATELGIIQGQHVGTKILFRPNAKITRAEAVKMLYNFINIKN